MEEKIKELCSITLEEDKQFIKNYLIPEKESLEKINNVLIKIEGGEFITIYGV